jgi:hypothetical protein
MLTEAYAHAGAGVPARLLRQRYGIAQAIGRRELRFHEREHVVGVGPQTAAGGEHAEMPWVGDSSVLRMGIARMLWRRVVERSGVHRDPAGHVARDELGV